MVAKLVIGHGINAGIKGIENERIKNIICCCGICARTGHWSHMVHFKTGFSGRPDVQKLRGSKQKRRDRESGQDEIGFGEYHS